MSPPPRQQSPHETPPLPLMLRVAGRLVVIVGGGAVGRRKATALRACGAKLRVVDPAGEPSAWPEPVECVCEPFRPDHLDGASLVLACTDQPEVNARVTNEARARGLWVSRADAPQESDFTLPAVHRTDGFTLAVATAAGSAALAAAVRDLLAASLPPELEAFAAAIAELRDELKRTEPDPAHRAELLRRLAGHEGQAAFRAAGLAGLRRLLAAGGTG